MSQVLVALLYKETRLKTVQMQKPVESLMLSYLNSLHATDNALVLDLSLFADTFQFRRV